MVRHNHERSQHQLLILLREPFQHRPDTLSQLIQHTPLPHNRTQQALIVSHLNRDEKSPMAVIDISIPQRMLKKARPHTHTIIPPPSPFKLENRQTHIPIAPRDFQSRISPGLGNYASQSTCGILLATKSRPTRTFSVGIAFAQKGKYSLSIISKLFIILFP